MYISGTQSSFQNRQHQLGNDATADQSFKIEFAGYSGLMTPAWTKKAQREFQAASYRVSGLTSSSSSNYPVVWSGGDVVDSITASTIVFRDDADAQDGAVYTTWIPSGSKIKTSILAQSVGGAMNWEVSYQPRTVGTPITLVPYSFTDSEGRYTVNMTAPYEGQINLNADSMTGGTLITVTANLANL